MLVAAGSVVPLWVVVIAAFGGIIVGFLIGARAKQLLDVVKNVPTALVSLKELMKKAGEEEEDDTEKVDDDDGADLNDEDDPLSNWLSVEQTYGLDDHADVCRNPIIMYHISRSKEKLRREKRRAQMIADGLDEDVVDQLLADESAGGGGGGGEGRGSALATLIACGARVKPVGDSLSAEAEQAELRRRQARTVDTFLTKERDIDTSRTQPKKGSGHKAKMSALEKAVATKSAPVGGEAFVREVEAAGVAKRGRILLRGLHARRKKAGLVPKRVVEIKRHGGGVSAGLISDADRLALLAEFDPDASADEAGEGGDDSIDFDDGSFDDGSGSFVRGPLGLDSDEDQDLAA
jgi:hypothetical protein